MMKPGGPAERAPLLQSHEARKPKRDTIAAAAMRQVRGGIGVQGVALALCALALAAGVRLIKAKRILRTGQRSTLSCSVPRARGKIVVQGVVFANL